MTKPRLLTKPYLTALMVGVSLVVGSAAWAQFRPGSLMRIVLLVDSSRSTSPMITQFRAGLNDFLDALPGEPEIVIISTGGQLRIRVGPTTDRVKLHDAASGFVSDGGGNTFLDTMLEADERFLKNAPDRRSVLVILTTDAGPWAETRTDAYNRFANDFLARGGRAHALVVRDGRGTFTDMVAEHLANSTGGFYETVRIANAVPKLMKTMAGFVAADQ